MKHLYVLMSWPVDMDVPWINFLSFVSFFLFCELKLFMKAHIFKDKHKVAGDINSLILLVIFGYKDFKITTFLSCVI